MVSHVDGDAGEDLGGEEGWAVVFANADGGGAATGMYNVHSSPVLWRHMEQWQRGMLIGSFPSEIGGRGWRVREMERQWHCANEDGDSEDILLSIIVRNLLAYGVSSCDMIVI